MQWARDRRAAENDRDSDWGPEDYFDGAMRGGQRGEAAEEIDELAETMLLVALCLAISLLVYLRARWMEGLRRAVEGGEEANQPREDGGLFPPPGDPARDDWAVLR
jgi:SEL1 protein